MVVGFVMMVFACLLRRWCYLIVLLLWLGVCLDLWVADLLLVCLRLVFGVGCCLCVVLLRLFVVLVVCVV